MQLDVILQRIERSYLKTMRSSLKDGSAKGGSHQAGSKDCYQARSSSEVQGAGRGTKAQEGAQVAAHPFWMPTGKLAPFWEISRTAGQKKCHLYVCYICLQSALKYSPYNSTN